VANLPTPLLYIGTVVIWGTAWFGITLQLGTVPILVSVAWRFLAAAGVLFAILWHRGERLWFPPRIIAAACALGLLNFSFSYFLFYRATVDLPSGVVSLVYGLIIPLNLIAGALIQGVAITARAVVAGVIGLAGLALVFLPELQSFSVHSSAIIGFAAAAAATLVSCLSQSAWVVFRRTGTPLMPALAWAMLAAGVVTLLAAVALDLPLTIEWSPRYLGSFVFLVLASSVLANLWYMELLHRIGLGPAAYGSLIYPVLALAISTVLEGFEWTWIVVLGVILVLAGNAMVLIRRS
jgi:drug/metabolite transporter (DMT)-like permease